MSTGLPITAGGLARVLTYDRCRNGYAVDCVSSPNWEGDAGRES